MSRYKRPQQRRSGSGQPEDFRIDIDRIFRDFVADEDMSSYAFPNDLSNEQRKYIHLRSRKFGLKSKSIGKVPNRTLTITKAPKALNQEYFDLNLSRPAVDAINTLLNRNPELMQNESTMGNIFEDDFQADSSFGKLHVATAVHVEPPYSSPLSDFRQSLPVYTYRESFLETLEANRIVIISAETGSGKTTQIPQYILESCCEQRKRCRIICTQPRRISTIAVAERVAHERGEQTGHTVGYQIKLESKLGVKTSLIYCTTGVLLRTLMNGDECCNNITHVIVDEIHERDKFSDFLLICLKECVLRYPHLRLILMSATMDIELYTNYFDNKVTTMYIPGRTYPVNELFLDDILSMIRYESETMKTIKLMEKSAMKQNANLVQVRHNVVKEMDPELLSEMDGALCECMQTGSDDYFAHIMQLILCESVPVNTAELVNGYTPLIVAAVHGNLEVLEQLINLGADIHQTSKQGRSALDWAVCCGQDEAVNLLKACHLQSNGKQPGQLDLLSIYDKSVSEDSIDFDLILAVVIHIHESIDPLGGILVFLPGYEDIVNCYEKITSSKLNPNKLHVCMLHGSMQISAQHSVFKKTPNKQKIILSTNVAETSITIDGVRFVIDSGKAKEKTYDSISGTSALQTCWISMACVKQRAGRAGRTQAGICFHIFSRIRYESFLVNTTPEILRVALHELCLQTKMLAPQGTSIAEFLSFALEPPPLSSIVKAVAALVSLGALDTGENLTPLGKHLLQLSVAPHLGKMLIYACIFKCLDPVLSIVASLAHKDPFVLPAAITQRSAANAKKRLLSSNSLSDHMSFLMAYQWWQDAKVRHRERRFCAEHFLSSGAMEMIMQTRIQLLSQLRAAGFVQVTRRSSIQDLNTYSENWPLVKATLAAGLYPNLAFTDAMRVYTMNEKKVVVHTSSCLRQALNRGNDKTKFLWIVFEEMSKVGKMSSIKCGTAITPTTVAFVCGSSASFMPDMKILTIDGTLVYRINTGHIGKFRYLLDNLVQRKVRNSRQHLTKLDEYVVDTLVSVMAAEDATFGLTHPAGVGGRPALIHKSNIKINGFGDIPSYDNTNNSFDSQAASSSQFQSGNSSPPSLSYSGESQQLQYDASRNSYQHHSQSRAVKSGQHPYYPPGARQNQNPRQYGYDQKYVPYSQQHSSMHQEQVNSGPLFSEPKANSLVNVVAPRNFSFPENSRFFFIRPTEIRNVIISVSQGTWNFSPQTEKKLFKLFKEGCFVVLLFTVRATNFIQGVANLLDTNKGVPNKPCPIEWLGTNSVAYHRIKRLLHPRLHIVEDGQEVNPQIGLKVCAMLMESSQNANANLRPILGGF